MFILSIKTYQILFLASVFPLQKCSNNLEVGSEPLFLRRFKKRQELSYPK